jgi:hypothetical protein
LELHKGANAKMNKRHNQRDGTDSNKQAVCVNFKGTQVLVACSSARNVIKRKGGITLGYIWYVSEGPNPTHGDPRCELSFQKAQQLFGKYEMKYLGPGPPKFPSLNKALDCYGGRRFVVFELHAGESTNRPPARKDFQREIRDGFYLIEISIEECETVLSRQQV